MTSITPLLGWRDYLHIRRDRVRGDAEYFCSRALELRELVVDLLGGGYTEGAEQALGEIAEEDTVDFCILVDLANQVDIPEVESLEDEDAEKLQQFIHSEPWRSLEADTHINVCLAMLRVYGESEAETIWHMGDPHLLRTMSQVFETVNREQLGRFVADINALANRADINFDHELQAIARAGADNAAHRLGIQTPTLLN